MENSINEKFDVKLTDVKLEEEALPARVEEKETTKLGRAAGRVRSAVVSIGTRTIVVVCSVLLIGAAVILNYALAGEELTGEPTSVNSDNSESVAPISDTYFASSVLSREQARDEAIEVLKTVVNNEATLEEAKEAALTDIARIASEIEVEANIETLIKSKGFEECIAVVTGDNANIVVRSDGLLQNELSQIKEIVYEQAGIDPVNIKIVEKK